MTTIITRAGKGTPLTNDEMDANLNNLNNDKIEIDTIDTLSNKTILTTDNNVVEATSGPDNSQLAGFRNKIINGDFGIWQRGLSVNCPAEAATYTADRAYIYPSGSNVTASKGPQLRLGKGDASLLVTGNTGNSVTVIGQRIEGKNILGFQGSPSTISFAIKTSVNKSLIWVVSFPVSSSGDDWSAGGTPVVSGNFNTTSTVSIVTLQIPANANFWKGGRIEVGTSLGSGETLHMGELQWEEGSIATPFEHRPYGVEYELCRRFTRTKSGQGILFGATQGTAGEFPIDIDGMRAVPTLKSGTGTQDAVYRYGAGAGAVAVTARSIILSSASHLLLRFETGVALGSYPAVADINTLLILDSEL